MKFNYQARNKTGEIQSGIIDASSEEAAISLLQKYGLYVTILEEVKAEPIYAKRIKIFERISRKEIVLFSQHLSLLFQSGVPLVESLEGMTLQIKNPDFKEKILGISEEVKGGTSFSKALARYPKIFSSFYVSMIESGESSGKLSESLSYLAEHLEREYHLYSKIRGAMIYPAFIAFVVLMVLALMIYFVIPQLSEVFKETGQELPLITKIIIDMSDFIKSWAWILILGFIGLIIFIFRYSKTLEGKKFFDRIFLRVPLLSSFLKTVYLSRFAENLSTLISGGLPITRALEISGEVVDNIVYKKIIFQAQDEVKKGETISSVLERFPETFPPLFIQMIIIGEKTGTLNTTLMNAVGFYQKEADRTADNFLSILEPVLIVFLGVVVGGIMISILAPLYQMPTF